MSEELHSSLKTAVKGTTLIFAGMVAGNLLWFALKIIIVRNVTVDELGLYSLTITIGTVLATLAGLGTQEGATRNISTFLGKGSKEDATSLARATLHINFLASMAAGILLFVLAGPLSRYVFYKPEGLPLFRVIACVVPLFTMSLSIGSILRGHGIIRHKIYYLDVGHPLYVILFLCAMILPGLTLMNIIYAFAFGSALVIVSISSYAYRKLGIPPLPLHKGDHYKDLLRFSLPLLVASVSGLILNWTDTLMLGRYTPAESVGIYNVSISLSKLTTFVLGAMGFIFLPMATEMHAKGQTQELKRTYQVLTKWVFAATFPLFFVLLLFPEMTIEFLFGRKLIGAAMPLRILSVGFLVHVLLGNNGMVLMAMGMTKTIMKISLLGAALNIVLNYLLIKRVGLGVIGASAATLASFVMINVLISMVLYRTGRIHPFTFQYMKPVIGASIVGLVIYLIVKKVFFAWWMMPVYLILFIVGYGMSLILSGSIEREDMLFVEGIERRIGFRLTLLHNIINRFSSDT